MVLNRYTDGLYLRHALVSTQFVHLVGQKDIYGIYDTWVCSIFQPNTIANSQWPDKITVHTIIDSVFAYSRY